MPVFDPKKMADLVAEESRVANELQAISIDLNQQHEDIKAKPDDAGNATYMIGQQKHGQLTRELGSVRAQRDSYGLREPKLALKKANAPLARWLRDGANGLEDSEQKMYLGEIKDGGIPGGGGQTFVVRGAVASDATSGQEAVQEEIPPRIIDKLAFYGGVSQMAQQFMTGTGGEYRVMQEDAASQEGEILGAQNTAIGKARHCEYHRRFIRSQNGQLQGNRFDAGDDAGCRDRHRGLLQPPGAAATGADLEQGVHPHTVGSGVADRGCHLGHGWDNDRRQYRLHMGRDDESDLPRSTALIARAARWARADSMPRWAA